MTDEDRKLLTLFLGECWHELSEFVHVGDDFQDNISDIFGHCLKCDKVFERGQENRTFTSPDDQHAVMEAIDRSGKRNLFLGFAFNSQEACDTNVSCTYDADAPMERFYNEDFIFWLFLDPSRFCQLAADAIKEGI